MTSGREELARFVSVWLSDRIEERLPFEVRRAKPKERRTLARRLLQRGQGEPPVGPTWSEVRNQALRRAQETLRARGMEPAALSEAPGVQLAEVAGALCERWGHPGAAPLARACYGDALPDEEISMDDALALVLGIASAAAALAASAALRRGRAVRVAERDRRPSDDFVTLLEIIGAGGPEAAIAETYRVRVEAPWTWSVLDLDAPAGDDARALLAAFAARGRGRVRRIAPRAGEPFDRASMRPPVDEVDRWVVARDTAPVECGFAIGDEVRVKAEVEACTADWRVLADPNCPVWAALSTRQDELIPGGAGRWRATWGIRHVESVRELAHERDLEAWRERLVRGLSRAYDGRPDRCPRLVGAPGEVFDPSIMMADGGTPLGDAVVTEVVPRDGVPQLGLACPGAIPLLLAVVRTRPMRGAP